MTKSISMDFNLPFADVKEMVLACVEAKEPILIHGKPGIGKSDLIREIGKETNREVIDIRLALLGPEDIKGYPFLKETTTGTKTLSFAMNDQFPTDPNSTAIIFFDEINAAMPSTQLAMYQMILDRAIGTYELPKGVSMVAAGNREADKGGIFSMPKPLENRFVHVEMEIRFKDWVEWAISYGIHPEIIGYLAKNEDKLNTFDPQTSSRAFATPRSWAKASKLLTLNEKMPERQIMNLMSGCIGRPVATEFNSFRKIAHEIPNATDILNGTAGKLQKSGPDIAYMLVTNCLHKLKDLYKDDLNTGKGTEKDPTKRHYENLDNLLGYLIENDKMIGKEFVIMTIQICKQRYKLPIDVKEVTNITKIMKLYKDFLHIVNDIQ